MAAIDVKSISDTLEDEVPLTAQILVKDVANRLSIKKDPMVLL